MGFGFSFSDIVAIGREIFGSGGVSAGASGATAGQISEGRKGLQTVSSWTSLVDPAENKIVDDYTGGRYSPARVGWPLVVSVEAIGLPGVLPEGTFFIGHASQGMIMQSFRMTQGGVPLELDYETRAGFIARLIQRTPLGQVTYIDGYEIGVERDSGRIVREDLTLAARSPLTAEVRYGGPIEPYLPLYIDISAYGDFASVADKDNLQVQVSATFLCAEVSPVTPGVASAPIEKEATIPYAIFAPF